MKLIETLSLKLSEEQREEFFTLIKEEPNQHPMVLYRRVLKQSENIEE